MSDFNLEIELCSAANPGSGEGWAGMIDSDVVYDEFGLPFIPARRVKGILREMAEEVINAYEMSGMNSSKSWNAETLDKLFGKRGTAEAAEMSVRNAYLPEYESLRLWLEWAQLEASHLATPENVITVFTTIRKQTKIEPKTGAAQDPSLRQIRVLKRGLKFCSRILLPSNDKYLIELFQEAVKVTRAFGGKRNRGLGKIRCQLNPLSNTSAAASAAANLLEAQNG